MTIGTETETHTTETVHEEWDGTKWVNKSRVTESVTVKRPARERPPGPWKQTYGDHH